MNIEQLYDQKLLQVVAVNNVMFVFVDESINAFFKMGGPFTEAHGLKDIISS